VLWRIIGADLVNHLAVPLERAITMGTPSCMKILFQSDALSSTGT
jgi:hypothetical protein